LILYRAIKGENNMIGNVLKYIRICNDFSTKEISLMIGTSISYVSDVENNRKKLSLDMINRFSNCFNIETSKILYLDELEEKGNDRKVVLKEILEYYIEKEKVEKTKV
jgi:transcriptional regulator with XRE-family HTH domain